MPDGSVDAAVEALARHAVAEVSPAELPIFAATAERYRADPQATLQPAAKVVPLGFGVETAVVLVTPYALDLVKRLFSRLTEKLGDSAADSIAGRITTWLGVKPEDAEEAAEPLSAEQLSLIADTTRAEAASLALAPAESERLADAIVAALATRT